MKVPGINLADVSISNGMSGDEMALVLQDSNLVLRQLSDVLGVDQKLPTIIAQSNIPLLIMPGDGAANGCQFTGSGGAFTLSAAIIANIGTSLAGCYAYFSAGFGGSSLPSGWYWTEFSSDTAGIVYAETYTTGNVKRPATKTAITPNLSGWVTGSTSEITAIDGLILPSPGKNGHVSTYLRYAGSTSGTKSFRISINGSTANITGASGSPGAEALMFMNCMDSHTEKMVGNNNNNSITGIASARTTYSSTHKVSIDTSNSTNMAVTLQGSTSTCAPVLLNAIITSTYGE